MKAHAARRGPSPCPAPLPPLRQEFPDAAGIRPQSSPAADHALHDAISRWRKTDAEPTVEGWASVGLTVLPSPRADEDGPAAQ